VVYVKYSEAEIYINQDLALHHAIVNATIERMKPRNVMHIKLSWFINNGEIEKNRKYGVLFSVILSALITALIAFLFIL